MGATRAQLTPDEIGRELQRMRSAAIAAKLRDFPAIPRAEFENAYGDVTVDALKRSFGSVAELVRFVHEGLRHDALDLTKSAAFRSTSALTAMIASPDRPEHKVLEREARELLYEFLAELSEDERKIAYLHFDPDYDWTPRGIADALAIPRSDVKLILDRVGIRLRRFAALAVDPSAICEHRQRDVLRWQSTGVMPLALRLHLRRCHQCRTEQRQTILAMRSAIVPLIPVATIPATATGAFARMYHAISVHPFVARSHEAIARVRKVAPVGGGGGAALAAKLAATTAVVTAGAALHAVTATSSPKQPLRQSHIVRVHKTHRVAAATIPKPHHVAVAADKPAPVPIPVRVSASRSTAAHAVSTTTNAQPPPAPSQDTAAPAPIPYSAPSHSAVRAAADTVASSPPAPLTGGGSARGGAASSPSSDTQSGPASPSGPPPP